MPTPSQSILPGQSSQTSHGQGRMSNSGTDDSGSIFSLLTADLDNVTTANIEKLEKPTTDGPILAEPDLQAALPTTSPQLPTTDIPTELLTPEPEAVLAHPSATATPEGRGPVMAAPVLEVIQAAKTSPSDSSVRLGELVRNAAHSLQASNPAQTLATAANNSSNTTLSSAQPGPAILSPGAVDAEGPLLNNPASGRENLLLNEQIRQALSQATEGSKFNVDAALSGQLETDTEAPLINQLSSARHITMRTDAATGVAKMDLPGNIQQPAWQQALAERVVFAANKSIQQVELQLHPAELGQVSIRIESNQDRAAIQMTAMHADTREALDAALPRLREMFTQQGMDLVHADVQQQTSQQQNNSADGESLMPGAEDPSTEEAHPPLTTTAGRPSSSDSLLDLYI